MIRPKEYNQFAGTITNNFGKDWQKVQYQFDSSYEFLKNIPDGAWLQLSQMAVSQWEGWPKNIVKAIRELYELWKRDAAIMGIGIKLNPDDDVRFPVSLMQNAFVILCNKGYTTYKAYCDQVGMPKTDRDRVENKHHICSAHEQEKLKVPEIGQRTNRKKPRDEIARLKESFDDTPF